MGGIVTITRASVDQVAGCIAVPTAATISVNILTHGVFDVPPAATAPASPRVQQRKVNTTVNPLAANQTSLAHSTSPFTRTTPPSSTAGGLDITRWTTAVKFPTGDTADTLTRRYC
jgi:hypothetical protein